LLGFVIIQAIDKTPLFACWTQAFTEGRLVEAGDGGIISGFVIEDRILTP
jgi:hypothetical protein